MLLKQHFDVLSLKGQLSSQQRPTINAPFQRRTQPSSPEEASRVLVMFQLTRHTWELWLSNWATICTSNLVGPVDVLSFLD